MIVLFCCLLIPLLILKRNNSSILSYSNILTVISKSSIKTLLVIGASLIIVTRHGRYICAACSCWHHATPCLDATTQLVSFHNSHLENQAYNKLYSKGTIYTKSTKLLVNTFAYEHSTKNNQEHSENNEVKVAKTNQPLINYNIHELLTGKKY